MNPNWLSPEDWKRTQDSVPICCVDVIPVDLDERARIARVGLIHRDTPHQGKRWCVVGGRMWRNESIAETAARQLRDTLGNEVTFQIDPDVQPDFVAQYFTMARPMGQLDPRQHAVAMMLVVPISGVVTAGGEADAFAWFKLDQLPTGPEWGFGQDQFVRQCLILPRLQKPFL